MAEFCNQQFFVHDCCETKSNDGIGIGEYGTRLGENHPFSNTMINAFPACTAIVTNKNKTKQSKN